MRTLAAWPLVLLLAFWAATGSAQAQPLPGQVILHPENPTYFAWNRDADGDGLKDLLWIAGPGDPEGFLYFGELLPDGTRQGPQEDIIRRIGEHGGNSIYMQTVRSHGGDGNKDENPFVGHDPGAGLNDKVLDQWESWFRLMQERDIIIYFFFFDDGARPWGEREDGESPPEERAYLQALVDRFQKFGNLIWVVAEEATEAFNQSRVQDMARIIREADEHDHIIGSHDHSRTDFREYRDGGYLNHYSMQYTTRHVAEVYRANVQARAEAAGRYAVVHSENTEMWYRKTDENLIRQALWAAGMAGNGAMILGTELKSHLDLVYAPTEPGFLQMFRVVQRFFEATDIYNGYSPLNASAYQGLDYALWSPAGSFMGYSSKPADRIVVDRLSPGLYEALWVNAITGETVAQEAVVDAGGATPLVNAAWPEYAVWMRRTGGQDAGAISLRDRLIQVEAGTPVRIGKSSLVIGRSEGELSFEIDAGPSKGSLTDTGDSFLYAPEEEASGADQFTYQVQTERGERSRGVVSFAIDPAGNQPPTPSDIRLSTKMGEPVQVFLTYEDFDGPGPYSFRILTEPRHGEVSGQGNDWTYTPDPGFHGRDEFWWMAHDGAADSVPSRLEVFVVSLRFEGSVVVPELAGAERMQAAYDAAGNLHVSFVRSEFKSPGGGGVYYARLEGGAWRGPVRVATRGDGEAPAMLPTVAGAGDGSGYVAWTEAGRDKVRVVRIDAAMSVADVEVFASDGALMPRLAADGAGNVFFIYRNKFPEERNPLYVRQSAAGGWKPLGDAPVARHTNGEHEGARQPALFCCSKGELVYAYRWMLGGSRHRLLSYRTYNFAERRWSGELDLFRGASKPWGPNVAVGPDGGIHMVWQSGTRAPFEANYRSPSGDVVRVDLPAGGEHGWAPSIAALSSGEIVITSSTQGHRDAATATSRATMIVSTDGGASFGPPQPLFERDENVAWPLVVSKGNTALLFWSEGGATYLRSGVSLK